MIGSFPRAILHIDGDAFFASCEQSRNPALMGRPVVTGKERGIAASMSYEAKARGVVRGMKIHDVKKVCPEAVVLPSDYETYSLLSRRFFSIVRRYTPDVEEYGIDECFADITGLRRSQRMSYSGIAQLIKSDLDRELGFTFSVGLAPTKVVAKIGSKWKKPSGLTVIPGRLLHLFLADLPVEKVWGIGSQTGAFLNKNKITTALEYARMGEAWVRSNLTKPFYEIWHELNGRSVLPLQTEEKEIYASIQKMKTFTPPSADRNFIFSQLSKNIENACIKARRYKLAAAGALFLLRSQNFEDRGMEVKFLRPTAIPGDIIEFAERCFAALFNPNRLYRSTGVVLLKLTENKVIQLDLFGEAQRITGMTRLYEIIDKVNHKYGKHKIYLGSSFAANKFSQHLGSRGDTPERTKTLFLGETRRRRLGIPMFMGE
jgi:DNA polymerase-4/DNA polymerase V